MSNPIHDVVFDGSTAIGTVELNGTRLSFETDEDAKFVFEVLNKARDEFDRLQGRIETIRLYLEKIP